MSETQYEQATLLREAIADYTELLNAFKQNTVIHVTAGNSDISSTIDLSLKNTNLISLNASHFITALVLDIENQLAEAKANLASL